MKGRIVTTRVDDIARALTIKVKGKASGGRDVPPTWFRRQPHRRSWCGGTPEGS
jgi:hypothetical protein